MGPQRTRIIRVGGAAVHLAEWGAGRPLLLLHGNPDSSLLWEEVALLLASDFHCLAPDLPGFGRSEVPAGFAPSLDGMAEFIESLRQAAGIGEPLDLAAHDFGGPFGLAWALRFPERVRRLVLINTLFFSDYRWHFWARVWRTPVLGEAAMALMTRPLFARELDRGGAGHIGRAHIDRTWALVTPRMKRMVLRFYRAADPAGFAPWEQALPGLIAQKPTLVLWGDRDPYIPARFAERFGAAVTVHLPGVGHWPPVEAPAEVAAQMLRHLAADRV
ncbi:MAG TPA: alpha/beta hydrolase [Stellaceae bacterium]|nr:alpha/beta hydrolase [Stellaceae bacterium]